MVQVDGEEVLRHLDFNTIASNILLFMPNQKVWCPDFLVLLLQSKFNAQIYLLCILNACKAEFIFD